MKNLRSQVDIHFVTTNEWWDNKVTKKMSTVEKKIASPLYARCIIYPEPLTAIKMERETITLVMPIYCGMACPSYTCTGFTTTTSSRNTGAMRNCCLRIPIA